MTASKWFVPSIAAVLLIVGGVYGRSCYLHHMDASAMAIANPSGVSGAANVAKAEVYDDQAKAQAPALKADDSEVARLRGEVARLRKAAPQAPALPDAPRLPEPESVALPVDLAPLVAKQDELIGALTKENADLKANVLTLTAARDSWRQSAGDFQREAMALRLAHEAQVAALKSERWKGRIEGFVVGLAGGYVAGKVL